MERRQHCICALCNSIADLNASMKLQLAHSLYIFSFSRLHVVLFSQVCPPHFSPELRLSKCPNPGPSVL
eukprot:6199096-Pleurochrysis_carterae.AAC.1